MSPWEARFFQLCALVASWSDDRSRQVGAVIVDTENNVLSIGYNGFPRRVDSVRSHRHSREGGEKYLWIEHAERNAIYSAVRSGASTRGARMFVSLFPCADCARAIIQSGILELNCFARPLSDERFDKSFDVATTMLLEAGVTVNQFAKI
ncbi:MAG: dCMP deaminase [Hyphomicrobiales bacterium]|nr:MAG: dCMP deaminase [Hyphomicrobiales bacterium]